MRVHANALYSSLLSDLRTYIDVQLPSWAPDSSPQQVACYQLRDSLLKKFNEGDRPSKAASSAALEKFRAVNERCKGWSLSLEHSIDEQLFGEIKSSLHSFWFHPEPVVSSFNQLFHSGRAGPGTSVKARGQDFYTKMWDSPITGTRDLHFVWRRNCASSPLWQSSHEFCTRVWPESVVDHSNYFFVNKTTFIARGACAEPSINMWYQLGFGVRLDRRLRSVYGYDSALQPDRNRVMARRGSIDGSLCTIDLESASDSIALNMLQEILPKDFLNWLKLLRCDRTRLPQGGDVELNMVSTMGNGFTFPLQTLLFHSIVQSAYKLLGIPMNRGLEVEDLKDPLNVRRNFSVFGDDIIVDRRAVRLVLRGLTILGFKVNADKTFVEGPFRESCGADYVSGINVRGVYVKSLQTQQDLCVAINNLNRWSAKTGVSLPETLDTLVKGIATPHRRLVPPCEDDAAGIHVPVSMISASNPLTSKHYWCKETKRKVNSHVNLYRYRAWVPTQVSLELKESYLACPSVDGLKQRNYNPSGLMLAGLGGYIRGGRILLRQQKTSYMTEPRGTPSWGPACPRPLEYPLGCDENRRFVDACARNLSVSGLEEGG